MLVMMVILLVTRLFSTQPLQRQKNMYQVCRRLPVIHHEEYFIPGPRMEFNVSGDEGASKECVQFVEISKSTPLTGPGLRY